MIENIVSIDKKTDATQIDRYLSSMRLARSFEKAKGFVFGYFTDCGIPESKKGTQSTMDVIKDYVMSLNKPTIYDFACGHSFPFVNLPIGVEVELDADNKTITIKEEFYKE